MNSSLQRFWEAFNFSHDSVEATVSDHPGSYRGLRPEALYTSDEDLNALLRHPLVTGTFCDIGCGTGKAAVLYGLLYPDREAIGIEREESRVQIGRSYLEQENLPNVTLFSGDLSTCEIPLADTYFLYFPTGPVLDRILSELYSSKRSFALLVIESHGDLIPRLRLENWLSEEKALRLSSVRHDADARIFIRNQNVRSSALTPFELSFRERVLVISSGGERWLGESHGLEHHRGDDFNLVVPPRTIRWQDVIEICEEKDLSAEVRLALRLRRTGPVEIHSESGVVIGLIRKIILAPAFGLEISTGEKVEWSQIQLIRQGISTCYESSSRV